MIWFDSTAEIKEYVGKALDTSVSFASYSSYIEIAEERFIEGRMLPVGFWGSVLSLENPSTEVLEAMRLYRRSLAWFVVAVGGELKLRQSESGQQKHLSDNVASGYKYEVYQTDKAYLVNAYAAMETFLRYVERINNMFLDSPATTELNLNTKQLVRTALDISTYSGKIIDRYTFESLSRLCREVEESILTQFLPSNYYEHIQTVGLNTTVLESKFITYLKRAICALVLEQAVVANIIQFEGGRVFLSQNQGDDSNKQEVFNATAFDAIRFHNELKKNRQLGLARFLAEDNISSFQGLFDVASGGTNESKKAWSKTTVVVQENCTQTSSSSKFCRL